MNKALFFLSFLLLCGCQKAPIESLPAESSSSEVSSTFDEDSTVASSSSLVIEEEESLWDEKTTNEMISCYKHVIPYCENDHYSTSMTKNNFNMPSLWVYCFYSDDNQIDVNLVKYAETLEEKGWSVHQEVMGTTMLNYEVYVAEKVYSSTSGVRLTFLSGGVNNQYCLGILGEKYIPVDSYYWPSAVVSESVDYTIPEYTGKDFLYDGYQVMDDTFGLYATIQIKGVTTTCCEDYVSLLEEDGWFTEGPYQGYYLAYQGEDEHQTIQFYYEAGEKSMYIYLTSCLPSDLR